MPPQAVAQSDITNLHRNGIPFFDEGQEGLSLAETELDKEKMGDAVDSEIEGVHGFLYATSSLVGREMMYPIADILPWKNQPRKNKKVDPAMATQEEEQRDPIKIVSWYDQDKGKIRYMIVDGERRYLKAQAKSEKYIKAVVVPLTNFSAILKEADTSFQKEGLDTLELADLYRRRIGDELKQGKKKDGETPTQYKNRIIEEYAAGRGDAVGTVRNHLKLLDLDPRIQAFVGYGRLTIGQALKFKAKKFSAKKYRDLIVAELEKIFADPEKSFTNADFLRINRAVDDEIARQSGKSVVSTTRVSVGLPRNPRSLKKHAVITSTKAEADYGDSNLDSQGDRLRMDIQKLTNELAALVMHADNLSDQFGPTEVEWMKLDARKLLGALVTQDNNFQATVVRWRKLLKALDEQLQEAAEASAFCKDKLTA